MSTARAGGALRGVLVGDRGFFLMPPLVGSVFLLVLLVVPGSPGYLCPPLAVAAGLGAATVAATVAVPGENLRVFRALALASSVTMTAAIVFALLREGSAELALTLLFWFPWVGGQIGLVWSRLSVALTHAALVAVVVLGALSGYGRLAAFPLAKAACGLSVLAAAYFTYTLFQRGRGRSFTDPLTALSSRAGLIQAGDPVVAEILVTGRRAVLMVVDLDHFKEINTAFGYEAGDEVLRGFARWLRLVKPAPLVAARLGGDKFALLLPGGPMENGGACPPATADPALTAFGRGILEQLDGRLRIGGVDVEVEATVGVTAAPASGDRITSLLSCADAALADARRSGERVGVWTTGMAAVQPWELALHAQLRSAINEGELELFYQPMRETATGRLVGVEALMRWRHPVRGLLPPGSFLPMAERSSLIVELTWWELDEALRQCARWRAQGIRVDVSANLSPRMLVVDELPAVVAERLAAYDLPPDILTLEITENALVSQPARAASMLGELRISGVKLSMDDFGTGYNSMEILKALTFDEIKIDRSFVADAQGSLPDIAIVRSVVDLGHRLGLRVVGEGIEDEPSERILTELGCDLLQGDALSPPLPARDLAPLLAAGPQRDTRHGSPVAGYAPAACRSRPERPTTEQPTVAREAAEARNSAAGTAPPPVVEAGTPTAPWSAVAQDDEQADVEATGRTKRCWAEGGLAAPLPVDEDARLAALHSQRLLGTPPEIEFDQMATLAAQIAECTYAHVVLVDADREWFKSWHGLKIDVLAGRVGVASHAVSSGDYLEVADARKDMRFAHIVQVDPDVPVRFFAGAPLRTSEGHVLGALCVSDRMPRRLAPGQRRALHRLADQTVRLCDARRERLMGEEITEALRQLDELWHPEDLPAAATLIADVVRSLSGADAVGVMLAKLPGATVFEAAGSSVSPGTEPLTQVGARVNPDDDAALRALSQLRDPLFIADPTGTPLIPAERVQKLKIGSALVIPFPDEGGLLGFVAVRWTYPLKRVEPSVMRAVTLFTTSARYTLHRLWVAQRPAQHGKGA
ncbi:diguanylate cyclase [Parafrankia colletiae]|uniref:Diguanylate cyclase n=1 Tax=Parafrankia colletiae TaxID=573497 RepID=A0A1S1QD23_9ACTN|nr:EAL domain-containing protein [Parafrankia colletiae]MCK9901640.1 EAL domain-containing protein [Frankia sp. Cpl3]OHV32723.1 diguanylate cyclase [Parafrankia colletiae]